MKKIAIVVLASLVALTACGGGGGSDSTPITTAKAEGAYSGTLSGSTSASVFELLVLENDEYWSIYGNSSGGATFVSGFSQGQGASNNGTYTTSNSLDFGVNPPLQANLTATYSATAISGTITESGRSINFSGSPIPAAIYNYAAPAQLSDVAGTWTLTSLGTGSATPVVISSTGAFTATNLGCSISGTITPRPTGKNVFSVIIRTGPSPCGVPNATGAGIAIANAVGSGKQLIVLGTYSRAAGFALFGTR